METLIVEFMKSHALCIKIVYLLAALSFTVFYGCAAIYIFVPPREIVANRKICAWRIHQFWTNILGQILGWTLAYYLTKRAVKYGFPEFKITDYIALIIAFLGVTGYLPTVLTKWQPKAS